MDLNFTPEENAFREEVRAFVRAKLPEGIRRKVMSSRHLDRAEHVLWQRTLHAQGWGGVGWPREFGGPGWTPTQLYIFEEECAAWGAPRLISFGLKMIAPVLMAFGTPAQQQRHLPKIMAAEEWWCQGYSEPGAGSDLASLKTRAERVATPEGEYYRVNGQKTWTTLGQYADWIFCLVRTDPQAKPQRGISFLLIDMKTPGITVRPIITLDGAHEVNEVWFEDVMVPVANRVGEENMGWTYAKFLLGHERTNIAGIGIAKRELARLKRLAETTGNEPLFVARMAQVEIDLMALEITNLRVLAAEADTAAGATGEKKAPGPEASILKIKGTEIQQSIAELLMQAGGLPALAMDAASELADTNLAANLAANLGANHCNQRKLSIFGGSNEIQKNIIAQMILGL